VRRSDATPHFLLVRHDANGHEHVLWRGEAWIAGGVPFDDHRMIVSTLSYQSSLAVLDVP
jgi:hypothetical protein